LIGHWTKEGGKRKEWDRKGKKGIRKKKKKKKKEKSKKKKIKIKKKK